MSLGNGVKLTWLGHATFLLETPGKKRVLIDPGSPGTRPRRSICAIRATST